MSKFKPGEGGRKKGSPNKVTVSLREWLNAFIDNNREQLQEDWKELKPRERIIIFEKLLKYTLPTLQATSLTTDFERLSDVQLDTIIDKLKSNSK